MQEQYCRLLDVSRNTYYAHKRENRPLVTFLEKYFVEEEIDEFLETGKLARLEDGFATALGLDLVKNLEIDHAIYSAKTKLQKVTEQKHEWTGGKEPVQILRDILTSIDQGEIKILTAKDVLVSRLKGYEVGNQGLSFAKFLNGNFSMIECYAICTHSDIVFDVLEEGF